MTDRTPNFAVSQFTTWYQSFEQDIEVYGAMELGGIEICERKLSIDPNKASDQLAYVRDSGLQVTSVQPRVHALFPDFMCPDVEDPSERMARYRQSIDLFATAFPDQNLPLVTITGKAPALNFRQAHRTARQLYRGLADFAADRGVRICYEPLSPVLMNEDTFICALTEAMQLIEDVGCPNFGLMLDLWHVWRESDIVARIAQLGDRIFGVHISDWPKGEPRSPGDRLLPGDGVMDLPAMFGAIERSGYRDAYCLEIFSIDELPDSLWRQDAAAVIQRARDGFQCAWDARR